VLGEEPELTVLKKKGRELPNIDIYQGCTREFAKVFHMAQKIKKKRTKVK
jgi:hypothetical protein